MASNVGTIRGYLCRGKNKATSQRDSICSPMFFFFAMRCKLSRLGRDLGWVAGWHAELARSASLQLPFKLCRLTCVGCCTIFRYIPSSDKNKRDALLESWDGHSQNSCRDLEGLCLYLPSSFRGPCNFAALNVSQRAGLKTQRPASRCLCSSELYLGRLGSRDVDCKKHVPVSRSCNSRSNVSLKRSTYKTY